jgi:hypothetical protein
MADSMSSAGLARFSATRAERYCAIAIPAAVRPAPSPSDDSRVLDHLRKVARSASGTPSRSQITLMGSGKANASSRSTSGGPAAI